MPKPFIDRSKEYTQYITGDDTSMLATHLGCGSLRELLQRYPAGQDSELIIDIGCGFSDLTRSLRDQGLNAAGMDLQADRKQALIKAMRMRAKDRKEYEEIVKLFRRSPIISIDEFEKEAAMKRAEATSFNRFSKKQRKKPIPLITADFVEGLPLMDDSCGRVFANRSISVYTHRDERLTVMKEVARVIQSGGWLHMTAMTEEPGYFMDIEELGVLASCVDASIVDTTVYQHDHISATLQFS